MKLPEILTPTGRKVLDHARAEIARLGRKAAQNKKGLTAKDKKDLQNHQALLQKNQRFKTAAALAGILGLGSIALAVNANSDTPAPQASRAETTATPTTIPPEHADNAVEHEAAIDALIGRIETAMPRFRQRIETHLRRMSGFPAPYIRSEVFWAPFEIVEINKGNPNRNYERFQRVARNTGNTHIGNPNFFLYDHFLAEGSISGQSVAGMAAAYIPAEKALKMAPDFNPDSLVELLILYHELRHTVDDSNVRARIRTAEEFRAYMAFVTGNTNERARMTIESEAGAYSYEIEVLNILLDDQLRQRNGNMGIEEVCRMLHLTSESDKNFIGLMLDMARAYYPHGSSDGRYNNAFPAFIAAQYRARGYDIYSRRPGGAIVPFNR